MPTCRCATGRTTFRPVRKAADAHAQARTRTRMVEILPIVSIFRQFLLRVATAYW